MCGDDELVRDLKDDYREADLSEADRAMLEYAEKLTLRPGDMEESDVENLRGAGFSDRAILNINLVVGAFCHLNRIADGLGVELDSFYDAVVEDSEEVTSEP